MIYFIMSIIYGIGFGCCAVGWYSSHKDKYMLSHKISLLQGAEAQLTNSLDFYIKENKELEKRLRNKCNEVAKLTEFDDQYYQSPQPEKEVDKPKKA